MEYALNIPNTEYSLELSNVTIGTSSYTAGTGIDITDSVISVKTEELSYEDLQDKPEIPTKTSELTNDSGFITISSVPTKTSELQNDSGFITQHQSLAAYRTSAAQDIIDANKQDKLTAGSNVTISNNVISASDTTYTAGSNVSISSGNVISATDTTYTAGENIQINGSTISATNTTYTAGSNVSISSGNVISATDTTYTAGTGISINNNVISATGTPGQEYYAGNGINIDSDNVISVKLSDDRGPIYNLGSSGLAVRVGNGVEMGLNAAMTEIQLQADFSQVQPKLQSGVNIKTINGENILGSGNIPISGASYTAGDGIDITNNEISVYVDGQGLETYDGRVRAKVSRGVGYYSDGSIGATKADNTILVTDDGIKVNPDEIQEKLTAGTGIDITNNVISATGSTQELLWCTYGVTTCAEILAAIIARKLPVCIWNNHLYVYAYNTGANRYEFSCWDWRNMRELTAACTDGDVWISYAHDILPASKCTCQTTAPTQDISDGGVHIVYLTSEPATKYSGYIYLIQEA